MSLSKQSFTRANHAPPWTGSLRDAPAGAVGALSDAERISLVTRPPPEPESPGAGSS